MDQKTLNKEFLRKVRNAGKGLLSQSDLMNCLPPDGDTRLFHSLIVSGFVEEVNRRIKANGQEVTFYRLTEKGQSVFDPYYKRFWFSIKGDIRTIIVASIISLITTVITLIVAGWFK